LILSWASSGYDPPHLMFILGSVSCNFVVHAHKYVHSSKLFCDFLAIPRGKTFFLFAFSNRMCSPPVFIGVRVTRSLVLWVCFIDRCLSFCTFSFGHCVVHFRYTDSDYPFGIFKLFLQHSILGPYNCFVRKRIAEKTLHHHINYIYQYVTKSK